MNTNIIKAREIPFLLISLLDFVGLFLHMTGLGELYCTEGHTNSEENVKHIAELNIFKKHISLNTKILTINFFYFMFPHPCFLGMYISDLDLCKAHLWA